MVRFHTVWCFNIVSATGYASCRCDRFTLGGAIGCKANEGNGTQVRMNV